MISQRLHAVCRSPDAHIFVLRCYTNDSTKHQKQRRLQTGSTTALLSMLELVLSLLITSQWASGIPYGFSVEESGPALQQGSHNFITGYRKKLPLPLDPSLPAQSRPHPVLEVQGIEFIPHTVSLSGCSLVACLLLLDRDGSMFLKLTFRLHRPRYSHLPVLKGET